MTIGKILYYILYVPSLIAIGLYYFFHAVDIAMEAAKDMIEDLLDEIKEF